MDPFVRHALLHGLDPIARTLQLDADIAAFEQRNPPLVSTTSL
jgi:3-isopropylmalate dehydratase small subunit